MLRKRVEEGEGALEELEREASLVRSRWIAHRRDQSQLIKPVERASGGGARHGWDAWDGTSVAVYCRYCRRVQVRGARYVLTVPSIPPREKGQADQWRIGSAEKYCLDCAWEANLGGSSQNRHLHPVHDLSGLIPAPVLRRGISQPETARASLRGSRRGTISRQLMQAKEGSVGGVLPLNFLGTHASRGPQLVPALAENSPPTPQFGSCRHGPHSAGARVSLPAHLFPRPRPFLQEETRS